MQIPHIHIITFYRLDFSSVTFTQYVLANVLQHHKLWTTSYYVQCMCGHQKYIAQSENIKRMTMERKENV